MEFVAELNNLPKMLEFIRGSAIQKNILEEKIYKIELASEEALVNIISYAFDENEQNTLIIECKTDKSHRFEVVIRDSGIPFNPIDAEVDENVFKPIEERKIGGLGIFMIRKLVDETSYQRVGNENILTLVFS